MAENVTHRGKLKYIFLSDRRVHPLPPGDVSEHKTCTTSHHPDLLASLRTSQSVQPLQWRLHAMAKRERHCNYVENAVLTPCSLPLCKPTPLLSLIHTVPQPALCLSSASLCWCWCSGGIFPRGGRAATKKTLYSSTALKPSFSLTHLSVIHYKTLRDPNHGGVSNTKISAGKI